MARVLVERETIYTAEVDMLMRGASYEEVLAYMEEHDKDVPDDPFGASHAEARTASEAPTFDFGGAEENTQTTEDDQNGHGTPTDGSEEE